MPARLQTVFAGLFGALLGLALLKFGNPIRMEQMVDWPKDIWQWLIDPWPVMIGYGLLAGVASLGVFVAQWKTDAPKILLLLPMVWLVWEFIAATQTEYKNISGPTVVHFLTCVVCFYLGFFSLSRVENMLSFWLGLLAGYFIVLALGFQQHFGGLEETRRFWLLYEYPNLKKLPPGLYKKMTSNRIFSTLLYPNTLAGVILNLMPISLAVFWSWQRRFTVGARGLLMGISTAGSLACLYWSGSKGGWLLMLVIGLIGAMYLPIQRRTKVIIVSAVLVLGLAGFFAKHAGYFKKGATSVEARFDYWKAAIQIMEANPLFGNGPGAFGKAYERVKAPESEMAQLTHNDYLEQACDSGLPGFLLFTAWIAATMVYLWRKAGLANDWVKLAAWAGLLGWALQALMEFGLYIPAIAWVAFALMGWLLGQCGKAFDSRPASG